MVVLTFFLIHFVPGSPITALMGNVPAPPATIQLLRHDYGLDKPVFQQLLIYISHLLHGNLGYSFSSQQSVASLILPAAAHTLLLMIPSLVIATILGIWLGNAASKRPGGPVDASVTGVALLGYAAPAFFIAQELIIVFAVDLGWFPAQGMRNVSQEGMLATVGDVAKHMVLPVVAITVYFMALTARIARTSLIEAARQDFVLTARAKGISGRRIRWVHILRNAAIPILSITGYSFGYALTGAVLTETVFAWPGIGQLFVSSIVARDYPVIEGIFILTAATVIVANLLTDFLYGVIDPRLHVAARA